MQNIQYNYYKDITLTENENNLILIFTESNKKEITISIPWNSKNKILFIGNNCNIKITILWEKQEGSCEVYGLFSGNKNTKTIANIQSILANNKVSINKHLISIIQSKWIVDITGNIHIKKWYKQVAGHLLEENIIIWEETKIKALPMLDIHSNDVQASHGVKIEKINEKKLFYILSRGIDKKTATTLIIDAYIDKVIQKINTFDQELLNEIKENFKKTILQS